jgi:hypothetical protein
MAGKPKGVYRAAGHFINASRPVILESATRMACRRFIRSGFRFGGGLVSYGIDRNDIFRRVASYIDRILQGTSPGELPVQTPTKFELVINLKTAKALGIAIRNRSCCAPTGDRMISRRTFLLAALATPALAAEPVRARVSAGSCSVLPPSGQSTRWCSTRWLQRGVVGGPEIEIVFRHADRVTRGSPWPRLAALGRTFSSRSAATWSWRCTMRPQRFRSSAR